MDLLEKCSAFNARYPIGARVSVRKDDGEAVITTTRSKASVLSGHSAVIWLDGIAGCYLLDRVSPVVSEEAHQP